MHTDAIAEIFAHPGPFATALVNVSQDIEDGEHQRRLRVDQATDQLTEAGAPQQVVEAVSERLNRPPHAAAPVGHIVVATETEIAFDPVVPARVDHTIASWQPLPADRASGRRRYAADRPRRRRTCKGRDPRPTDRARIGRRQRDRVGRPGSHQTRGSTRWPS
ncbi:MAG: hypothetical protein ACRDQA_09470 [Nocardioidaceae bacterium]